jgi:hypothetical protein
MLDLRLIDTGIDHLAFAIRSDLVLIPWAHEYTARNLDALSQAVDGLEWVTASSLALSPGEAAGTGPGLVGSLAVTVRDVVRTLEHEASEPAGPVAEAVRSLVDRGRELEASSVSALSAVEDLQGRLARSNQVLHQERERADLLETHLVAIEATLTWRIRRVLLPMLRPLSRAIRLASRSRVRWRRTEPQR